MTTKFTNKNIFIALTGAAIFATVTATVIYPAITSASGPTINQGTTSTYGVLAATTVTNTGTTNITGTAGSDLGIHPGTAFTNSGTLIHTGAERLGDAAAGIAQTDLVTAYNDLSIPSSTTLSATDITGQTFTPGSYNSGSEISIANAGNITFDAQGDPTAVFIMKAVSTVITGTTSTMTLANGAQACNVYWQVGSSATLGVNSSFIGHIYAMTSITANTGATIYGQLLARTGAVTLDGNTIVNNNCAAIPTPTPTPVVPQEAPAPLQDSVINSVSTSACTTTEDYKIYLNGIFPSAIQNIAINSTNISSSQWSQTATWVGITIPKTTETRFTIELYNGRLPLMPVRVFTCIPPEPISVPEIETPTVEGGELPDTGSNNYNYLLLGAVLIAAGAGALLVRRRNKK